MGQRDPDVERFRVLPGERVPKERYTSNVFMRLEQERLWPEVWLLAAHLAEIQRPGDYVSFDIGVESIIVVRGTDAKVRAFHNVCQHRGNRLCRSHRGHVDDTLRCGYHHWEYGTDGSLRRVPNREQFGPSFQQEKRGLQPVRCDTAFGFVFVCLSPEPEPLESFLAPIRAVAEPYGLETWALTQQSVLQVDANWKTSSDVNNEAYHLPSLHPQVLQVVDPERIGFEPAGPHTKLTVPIGQPSTGDDGADAMSPMLAEMLREAELDPEQYRGRPAAGRRALQAAIRKRGERRGYDYSGLSDDQMTDNVQLALFPNVQLNLYVDRLLLFRHRPHPSDPHRAFFDQQVYERRPDPVPPARREELSEDYESMGEMMAADLYVLRGLQQGMRSSGFRGLELCTDEAPIRHLHETIDRYVLKRG